MGLRLFFYLILLIFLPQLVAAQGISSSPYRTSWKDGVITGLGIGASYWGLRIMDEKEGVPQAELDRIAEDPELAKKDVPRFDRWAAGNYDEDILTFSDYPFYGSFGLPLLFLLEKDTRQHAGQIGLLYVQTMSITGTLFTQVVGRTHRNRPLVYNVDPDNADREQSNAQNSFFAGHTAATASATFFAAKVFNDFFPDSPARPYVWIGAALIPASVGYARLEGGKHYLSDNLLGYAIGASAGILVPHLHKISKNSDRFSLLPVAVPGFEGFAMQYKF